jgi:hypothetical protein
MLIPTNDSGKIAKIIYESYPESDLLPLDPETDLVSLERLYGVCRQPDFGDSLLRFVVAEAVEGSAVRIADCEEFYDTTLLRELLDRGRQDLDRVQDALWKIENE